MTYGFNPKIAKASPFHGAMYAVIDSVTKMVAMGADYKTIRLTFQEYFEKLGQDPKRWGKPMAALLGALRVQKELSIPSIGGKDSMSGTFMDINVPPTLVSFAVAAVWTQSRWYPPSLKKPEADWFICRLLRMRKESCDFEAYRKSHG